MALRSSIIITALVFFIVGAGIAYVGIPTVEPTYNANTTTVTQTVTQSQTGIIQETLSSWQDLAVINDNQLTWSLMNKAQVNFTISSNSYILAQFNAPYLVYLDPTFTGAARWEVSLVISGIGNTTARIEFSDNSAATNQWRQITFSPTLSLMTGKLSAGTYNCSVWWRSLINPTGTNQLIVSNGNTYKYDRSMLLQEIKG